MEKLKPYDIILLALEKKAVSIPKARIQRMPAAFLQNMQFSIVMRYIEMGMYEYHPKKKHGAPWPGGELLKSDF